MSQDEIINALKVVFAMYPDTLEYLRSRKREKIIEKFLDQFKDLTEHMPLFSQNMEGYLGLLNAII